MDTRFWGPSGWKLLHLITFKYDPKNAQCTANFLETLPYILPCKFCRASLTDYYRKLPYISVLESRSKFTKWMYNIHNCVNDKLRKQGLNPSQDPPFSKVKAFYEKWITCSWEQQLLVIWDFLFAVAYNHPKETSRHSKPMPECPPDIHKCKDNCEKNKWNVLSEEDRMIWYTKFWNSLPVVLPHTMQEKWMEVQHINPPNLQCRRSTLAWLWRMRCSLDSKFKDPYTSICKKISQYSSDCGKNKKAYTCRKTRKKQK
jgi:hypothetical protein